MNTPTPADELRALATLVHDEWELEEHQRKTAPLIAMATYCSGGGLAAWILQWCAQERVHGPDHHPGWWSGHFVIDAVCKHQPKQFVLDLVADAAERADHDVVDGCCKPHDWHSRLFPARNASRRLPLG